MSEHDPDRPAPDAPAEDKPEEADILWPETEQNEQGESDDSDE